MQNEAGLSLLELLISLALLALITSLTYPSLSTVLASWQAVAFDSTPADDYAAERFLRRRFEQAIDVFERERSTREKLLVFDGDAESVSFVSPLSNFGAEGSRTLSLSTLELAEIANQQQVLGFSHQTYRPGLLDEEIDLQRELVIEKITNAQFRYYSAKRKRWVAEWKDAKTLPLAVRLDFSKPNASARSWFFALTAKHRVDRSE